MTAVGPTRLFIKSKKKLPIKYTLPIMSHSRFDCAQTLWPATLYRYGVGSYTTPYQSYCHRKLPLLGTATIKYFCIVVTHVDRFQNASTSFVSAANQRCYGWTRQTAGQCRRMVLRGPGQITMIYYRHTHMET